MSESRFVLSSFESHKLTVGAKILPTNRGLGDSTISQ
jgi:hypothetical protein